MICIVEISRDARKQLKKVPAHVATKLQAWIDDVEACGLEEVRKRPGFHDEPLQGDRKGQRSIRLSKSWRAVYVVVKGAVEFARVEEVMNHDY